MLRYRKKGARAEILSLEQIRRGQLLWPQEFASNDYPDMENDIERQFGQAVGNGMMITLIAKRQEPYYSGTGRYDLCAHVRLDEQGHVTPPLLTNISRHDAARLISSFNRSGRRKFFSPLSLLSFAIDYRNVRELFENDVARNHFMQTHPHSRWTKRALKKQAKTQQDTHTCSSKPKTPLIQMSRNSVPAKRY